MMEALGLLLFAVFFYALYFVVRAAVRDGMLAADSARTASAHTTGSDHAERLPGDQPGE